VARLDGSKAVDLVRADGDCQARPGSAPHKGERGQDERGWTGLYASAGFFVEEREMYALTDDGWRGSPDFRAQGVVYGARGPAASAVLCAELRPGRLRRLATPSGLRIVARRRAGRAYRRLRRSSGNTTQ